MKLKKILLPLATVASTAAVVTPIITSCNGGHVNAQTLFDGKYERATDTVLTSGEWKPTEATTKYLDALNANKNIFEADLLEYINYEINDVFAEIAEMLEEILPVPITRIADVTGSLGVTTTNVDSTKGEISTKVSLDIHAKNLGEQIPVVGPILEKARINLTGSLELNNFKVKVITRDREVLPDYKWGLRHNHMDEDYNFVAGDLGMKARITLSVSNLADLSGKFYFNYDFNKNDQSSVEIAYTLFDFVSGFPLGSLKNITVGEE